MLTDIIGVVEPVDGVPLWLFLVDDGEGLVASFESGQSVSIGRAEVSSGFVDILTPSVVASRDFATSLGRDFEGIADHWHIFIESRGEHWIAFSMTRNEGRGPEGRGLGLVVVKEDFSPAIEPVFLYDGAEATNDLFMVETSTGVAIGIVAHDRPDQLTMLLLDFDDVSAEAITKATVSIDGRGVANGSSARYTPGVGWRILAPENLFPPAGCPILRVNVWPGWRGADPAEDVIELLPATAGSKEYAFAMPMEAVLPSGFRVLVVRRTDTANRPGGDAGAIVLYVLDETGEVVLNDGYEIESVANRPHVVCFGGKVIVTYDHDSTAYAWIGEVTVTVTDLREQIEALDSNAGVEPSPRTGIDRIDPTVSGPVRHRVSEIEVGVSGPTAREGLNRVVTQVSGPRRIDATFPSFLPSPVDRGLLLESTAAGIARGLGTNRVRDLRPSPRLTRRVVTTVTRHLEEASVLHRYTQARPTDMDEAGVLHLYRPPR